MDDLLTEFLTETFENLSVLDVELMKLEQSPNDMNLLGNIFRLVHTVKGTCGFLRLPRLETVAHAGENVLGRLRDGELVANTAAVSLILECLDRIRMIMADLERTGSEPEGDDQDLIRRLNSMAESASAPAGFGIEPAPSASSIAATSLAKPADSRSIYEQIGGMGTIDAAVEVMFNRALGNLRVGRLFAGHDNDHLQGRFRDYLAKICGGPDGFGTLDPANSRSHFLPRGVSESNFDALAGHLHAALGALEVPANLSSMIMGMIYSSRGEILEASATRDREASHRASAPAKEPAPRSPARTCEAAAQAKVDVLDPREISVTAQSIRVNVDLIENLMAMVSELVLTRNQVLQILRKQKDSEFAGPLQRLNRVTTELQEGVMKTRMQPIGNAWSKLPRLVRDLSHELKKKIDLEMIGQHTELDRQVLEMIRDPLTHMVRNSADHGMETPGERLRAGKPEVGKITLNAYHEGGQIVIEIADDGRGLPLEKIKAKILQSGLAGERDLETMPERQIQQYIFKAGFSTAAKVTGVSGRGVGMDVVRSNIEKIGGTVELHSREGKGTRFVVKIPLTLAIVSALIVECAGERFAIPQISVVELVRSASNAELQVERIKGTPVLRLRNRLLPLVSLRHLLRLDAGRGHEEEETCIVVIQVGAHNFGIMVDRVLDTEEIVVKPVAPILRDIEVFSGNTILGDGSVIMILDPNGIASQSGQFGVSNPSAAETAVVKARSSIEERIPLLLCRAGSGAPKVVPLGLVARLEEFDRTTIETSNGRYVVQYRDHLMPLISLDPQAEMSREAGRQPVLVFRDRDRSMGLMVDKIVDIVEGNLKVELRAEAPGRIGTALIAGQATDIVDVGYYLSQAFEDWFKPEEGDLAAQSGRRLLLVDDSAFFLNLMVPQLSAAGFQVTAVESPDRALQLCEKGAAFDIIVSDIEMPGMSGFEFCESVKAGRWRDVPIIALSSCATPRDLERGRSAGFDDYVAKYDRDGLVDTIKSTLTETRGAA